MRHGHLAPCTVSRGIVHPLFYALIQQGKGHATTKLAIVEAQSLSAMRGHRVVPMPHPLLEAETPEEMRFWLLDQ